jgi:condensation domain-containing protein/phosphopantetheine binding protein
VASGHGERLELRLDGELSAGVKALAAEQRVTVFMLLLATLAVLLHRWSCQEDLLIGPAVAERERAETAALIGPLVNTLVPRTDLSGNPRFRELIDRVSAVVVGALSHRELPFATLVRELPFARDRGRGPNLQAVFVLKAAAAVPLNAAQVVMTLVEMGGGTASGDLLLELWDNPAGLSGHFEYSTDLFDAATIGRLAGQFRTLLAGLVADPEQRIAELPLSAAIGTPEHAARSRPRPTGAGLAAEVVPPRSPVEERLVGIWEELLGVHPIGVTDSFFDLGGNALLVTRLIAQLRDAFQLDLPASIVVQARTVANLATVIVQRLVAETRQADLESIFDELTARKRRATALRRSRQSMD